MTAPQPTVRLAEHNGDATIDVRARDEAAGLRGAVQGLATLAGAPADLRSSGDDRRVAVEASEPVERLVALLNELIAIVDVEGLLAVDADVAVDDHRAEAAVRLAPLDPGAAAAPPKAATWHAARSEPVAGGGWHARVVIDR